MTAVTLHCQQSCQFALLSGVGLDLLFCSHQICLSADPQPLLIPSQEESRTCRSQHCIVMASASSLINTQQCCRSECSTSVPQPYSHLLLPVAASATATATALASPAASAAAAAVAVATSFVCLPVCLSINPHSPRCRSSPQQWRPHLPRPVQQFRGAGWGGGGQRRGRSRGCGGQGGGARSS